MVALLLADSHCHLDQLQSPADAVKRASDAGVKCIVSASVDLGSMVANLALAKGHSAVECALGMHPSNILRMDENEISEGISFAERNIRSAAAIGEVGLDFKHAKTDAQRALQERVFRDFIRMAKAHSIPLCVHARYAETRCLDILAEEAAEKVHMHWFTNSKKTAARAVSLGHLISCGPIILSDMPSAEVVRSIPLSNLLLETDAPVPFIGKVSEPSWIPRVCARAAELHGTSEKAVEDAAGDNFSRLFGKEKIH